jgi:hypothetical protein
MSGHNLAGANLPGWYDPAPYSRSGYWDRLAPWFVLVAEQHPTDRNVTVHRSSNTRVQIRNIRLMVRRNSWSVVNVTNAPDSNVYHNDIVTSAGRKAIRFEPESNGGGSSHLISDDGTQIIHGYPGYFRITNPWELTGIAVDFEMRLILDDPRGPDDRHLARYLAHIGCDLYPSEFNFWRGNNYNATPAVGYWPAVAGSAFLRVTNEWQGMALTTYYPGGELERGPSMPWLDDSWLKADPPPDWGP